MDPRITDYLMDAYGNERRPDSRKAEGAWLDRGSILKGMVGDQGNYSQGRPMTFEDIKARDKKLRKMMPGTLSAVRQTLERARMEAALRVAEQQGMPLGDERVPLTEQPGRWKDLFDATNGNYINNTRR